MNRQRLFRGVRVAWTAGCGLLCLLLVVLWVRSYSRLETISGGGRGANSVSTIKGSVFINERGFMFAGDDSTIGATTYSSSKRLAGGRIVISSTYGISDFDYQARGKGLKFPIWLFAVALVVVAALPWLPWLSTRFSLRTLLIATTLIAVGLGLIVYVARR